MLFTVTYVDLFMARQEMQAPMKADTAALAINQAVEQLTKEAQELGFTVDFDYSEQALTVTNEEGEIENEFFSFQAEALEAPEESSVYSPSRPSQSINKAVASNNTLVAVIYRNAVRFELKSNKAFRTIKIKRITSASASCQPWRMTATSIVVDSDLFPGCLELEAIRDRFLEALLMYF